MTVCRTLFPAIFVNHGGGPMPLMGRQPEIASHLETLVQQHFPTKPKAIVVISAHWESNPIKITSSPAPNLLFDYHGFPKETYQYQYPAKGHPELALRIQQQLAKEGLHADLDPERGYDHGVFVPLLLMYPQADIPVVSVSLHQSLDVDKNMAIGRALKPLREEGILILGSGYTFHNMNAFFNPSDKTYKASVAFNDWLKQIIVEDRDLSKLQDWERAPGARICHPREEHLMPLFVVAAATSDGEHAKLIYDTRSDLGNHAVTGYLFSS